MTSGLEMINDINGLCEALQQAVKDMAKHGKNYAEKESVYKVKVMQEALRLKDSGMAVTLIDKVIYGFCAKEKQERDIAEAYYKTAQENVNAIKLRIRVLDNQIAREWGNEK